MIAVWRVYFNKFSEAPLCWSIDSGEGTEERKFQYLRILGGDIKSNTDMANRGSEDKPCAWFEVHGLLKATGLSATILGEVRR